MVPFSPSRGGKGEHRFKEDRMSTRQLGDYEVLSHQETPECSLRLLRFAKDSSVRPHHHHKTTQTYFVLEGTVQVTVGEETSIIGPHQILRAPVDAVHSLQGTGDALVLSISIPPLQSSDQHVAAHR
jgi:mannose-6-phosphate isomerase-like protein (cupin superfamily)